LIQFWTISKYPKASNTSVSRKKYPKAYKPSIGRKKYPKSSKLSVYRKKYPKHDHNEDSFNNVTSFA
jgi:hypothetical protein